jgi:hypothetical protein
LILLRRRQPMTTARRGPASAVVPVITSENRSLSTGQLA